MRRLLDFLRRYFGHKEWAALAACALIALLASWTVAQANDLESLEYTGGFLAMLLSSATVILPAPGLAVVATLGPAVSNPLLLGIISGIGATIGEIIGYLAGYSGHRVAEEQKHFKAARKLLERCGFFAIAVLAFIPNPLFDVAGIIAGSTKYPINLFIYATVLGKIAKCTLVAYTGAWTLDWLGYV